MTWEVVALALGVFGLLTIGVAVNVAVATWRRVAALRLLAPLVARNDGNAVGLIEDAAGKDG